MSFIKPVTRSMTVLLMLLAAAGALAQTLRAEGSANNPVRLGLDQPHTGQVDTGVSYYSVSVIPQLLYRIALTGLQSDADLYVYDDDSSFDNLVESSDAADTMDETVVIEASGDTLYFTIDGGFTDQGTSFELEVAEYQGGRFVDEGSRSRPVTVTVGQPYAGQVGEGASYYVVAVEPQTVYQVVLSGLIDDADIEVFGDGAFSDQLGSSFNGGAAPEEFRIAAPSSRLYIQVDGSLTSIGSPYTLSLTEAGDVYAAEGTGSEPMTIQIGRAHSGQVSTGDSFYRVTVTRGRVYAIELSELEDDADLQVYHDPDLRQQAGGSAHGGDQIDAVDTIPITDNLYIVVSGDLTTAGTSYRLLVEERGAPPVSEGRAVITPLTLREGVAHRGQVSTGRSYYSVATTPGTAYEVILRDLSADADLIVHDDDATFSHRVAFSNAAAVVQDRVQMTASGTSLYITVDGANTNVGATYELIVRETGALGAAEGSRNSPLLLAVSAPHRGQVDTTRSYYAVQVVAGREYTVALTGPSDDVDLTVHGDSALSNELGSSANGEREPEVLQIEATSNRLYITADGTYTTGGGFFTLTVTENVGS